MPDPIGRLPLNATPTSLPAAVTAAPSLDQLHEPGSRETIDVGEGGASVATVKAYLRTLGYSDVSGDDVFDERTSNTVGRFQSEHSIATTRKVGTTTLAELERQVKMRQNPAPSFDAIRSGGGAVAMKEGQGGKPVEQLQGVLSGRGRYPVPVTGSFDADTTRALKTFQRDRNIEVTGVLGPTTLKALETLAPSFGEITRGRGEIVMREGMMGPWVKDLQQLLYDHGYDIAPDSEFGPGTTAEIRRLQQVARLGVDGTVGPLTLEYVRTPYSRNEESFENGRSTGMTRVRDVGGVLVAEGAVKPFLNMLAAARSDGVMLGLNSGFRTMAEQRRLYDGYVNHLPGFNPANVPGTSSHQKKRGAVDIDVASDPRVSPWLERNASRFGFADTARSSIPGRDEPWHWEHLG